MSTRSSDHFRDNRSKTWKYAKDLETLLGIPEKVGYKTLDILSMIYLHEIAEQSISSDSGLPESVLIEIPFVGTLKISRIPNVRKLTYEFIPVKEFEDKLIRSLYEGDSPLTNLAEKSLKEVIIKKYNALL